MQVKYEITIDSTTRHLETEKPVSTIGRSASCDIVLKDETVSSRHARLKIYREFATIEDLGSSNGTFVNGTRITGAYDVFSDSIITFGKGGPTIQLVGLPFSSRTSSRSATQAAKPHSDMSRADQPKGASGKLITCGLAIGGVVLLLALSICLVTGGYFAINNDDILDRRMVRKIVNNDEQLANAVGLVVIGFHGVDGNGEKCFAACSTGTGFCVTEDGYVFTNRHVVENYLEYEKTQQIVTVDPKTKKKSVLTRNSNPYKMLIFDPMIWVILDGQVSQAEITHVSKKYDFCILKIDRQNLNYFRLSDAGKVDRVSDVFALGFPGEARLGISREENIQQILRKRAQPSIELCFKKRDLLYTATSGAISVDVNDEATNVHWIQHTADIHKGNSGGPLCLSNGTVVGINTQFVNREDKGTNPVPIYFSFTLEQLKTEIERTVPNIHWAKPQ